MLITIGSFDGFHKGHMELLRVCRENSEGANWGVVTFHPHPAQYVRKMSCTLFSLRERELIRRVIGIPHMYVLEFSEKLRSLSPRDFWSLVRKKFNVDGVVMGSDFHFGRNREGNAEYLLRLGKDDGLRKVLTVPLVGKAEYSSSRARQCFAGGKVEEACEILGYPCVVMGKILHGNGRGHKMSLPTANVDIKGRIAPADGVYSAAVLSEGKMYCGAVSVGRNPTFGDVAETRCEVHMLDFQGNVYGEELVVFFLGRVRDMHKFSGREELMRRIAQDVKECQEIYCSAMKEESTRRFLDGIQKIDCRQNLTPEIVRLV